MQALGKAYGNYKLSREPQLPLPLGEVAMRSIDGEGAHSQNAKRRALYQPDG